MKNATTTSMKNPKKKFYFESFQILAIDKSLYVLLQVLYELKLISENVLHHATTCETDLLLSIGDK